MIYLDNAATTGRKPKSVIRAVNNALTDLSANPGRSGHTASLRAGIAVFTVREKIADYFGASGPDRVVFTSGCTASLNYVIKGVLNNGDHVVISSLEHNSVARPVHKLHENGVIDYSIAEVVSGDKTATLENFGKAITPNTKLVICTHASNVTGESILIGEIGKLCQSKGVLLAVDAAQSAGVLPINVNRDNIDFLCIAAHKGLYAPMGVGILIAEKNIEKTLFEGGTGTSSINLLQPEDMPEKLESGTVNVPGIMGVGAGVDFIKEKGIENIYSHEISLASELFYGLNNINGVVVYSSEPKVNNNSPVISFNYRDKLSMQVADYLSNGGFAVRAGLHCAPLAHRTLGTSDTGTVRVSPSVFNSKQQIDAFLMAVKHIKL